jgi:hypothetical protein
LPDDPRVKKITCAENDGEAATDRVEALTDQQERSSFGCGVDALDRYFQCRAGRDARRNFAIPFVLVECETQTVAKLFR